MSKNKHRLEKCDKCHSDILMGRCSCGYWYEKGNLPEAMQSIEKVILEFNKSGKDIQSGDHHSGVCYVFFKGDYKKCMKVVEYVEILDE